MGLLLLDEQPIFANKTLAREIGLNEALVLQQINYWIEINKKSGKNYFEGKYWTYNSLKEWHEREFDYMSYDTVKRTFAKLEKEGYLLTGNFNRSKMDKTKWYTINEEKLEELSNQLNGIQEKVTGEIVRHDSKETNANDAEDLYSDSYDKYNESSELHHDEVVEKTNNTKTNLTNEKMTNHEEGARKPSIFPLVQNAPMHCANFTNR